MKITIIVILSVAVTLGLVFGISSAYRGSALGGKVELTAVRVEPAGHGTLTELVSIPGEIQPEQKVQISSRVPAQILALPFKEGENVTGYRPPASEASTRPADPPASSVVVRLDARDLRSSLQAAEARAAAQEAEIDVAKARVDAQRATLAASAVTLADAERELRRQEQLWETKDVSQQAVDQAKTKGDELRSQYQAARHMLSADETNLIVLRHNLDASRADINKAREQLNYTVIASPIDGTIIKLNSKVGESVVPGIQGSPGSVILEVADLSRMLMIGQLDEASVAQVKVGQRATVRMPAYRNETFEGVVQSVALAKADPRQQAGQARTADGSNYYEVRILLTTNGRRIFSGLNADADIETNRHTGVRVPSQAVLGRPVDGLPAAVKELPEVEKGKQFASVVYRLVGDKAVVTPVRVGPSDETHTLVESGLKEGEVVIIGPYKNLDTLQNDQQVKVESTAPAATQTVGPATRPTTTPAGER